MSPRTLAELAARRVPLLTADQPIGSALEALRGAGVPALPVIDARERLVGLFGQREFLAALFPRYLGQLTNAAFVRKSLDHALEKRAGCRSEPVATHMNTDHVEVGPDFSDAALAEIFLHHRVLVVPVVDDEHHVQGVITRADFFDGLADRFLDVTA